MKHPTFSKAFAISAAMLSAMPLYAVKANPRPTVVTQPDGTQITVRLNGDERFHYISTLDGKPLETVTGGYLREMPMKEFEARRVRAEKPARAAGMLPTTFPTTGKVRGCVILVEYQDVSFTVPSPQEEFTQMLNAEGYSNYGGTGSARDWFIDQSQGKFMPDFDVYGPVKLPHDRAYYGENGSNGDDIRAHLMLTDACDILDDEVDFSQYDFNDDGWIDNVFIFYAGYGENLGYMAGSDCVWPHSWDLVEATSEVYMHDGVRLNHYACTNEIDLENKMDGIGTFVHEFSHVLGLPDLYSTNGSSAFTPGPWNVMDEGPYNNGSRTPPNYSAYERYALGWLVPREIGNPANIRLSAIDTNSACIIKTHVDNEFFLIENRQQKGWDQYIPGHGMLVWHIEYNANIWKYNSVNNAASHQYVDIEEADGTQTTSSRSGDSFPGTAGITSFTSATNPSMTTSDGTAVEKPITDIREANGIIEFRVSGGRDEVPTVTAMPATNVGIDSFTASWTEGNAGCQYLLSVYTVVENESGRPETTYVSGWEARNVGSSLSVTVTDLHPETEYRYVVRVVDAVSGLQSVGSNEVTLTTLPATFDYLRPEVTELSKKEEGWRITWTPVEDAEEYLVSVYEKSYGEFDNETADFTGGVSSIPSGWSSASNLTYANQSYCGAAVPSLRMNIDGQTLTTPAYEEGVHAVSFWSRGVSAAAEATVEVQIRGYGDWTSVASFPVDNSRGVINRIEETSEWPEGASSVKIIFHNGGKGSLALDDVAISYGGDVRKTYFGENEHYLRTPDTSFILAGLPEPSVYYLTVTGFKDGMFSKTSYERRIVSEKSGSSVPVTMNMPPFTVDGFRIILEKPAELYTASGLRVAVSEKSIEVPASGLYILRSGDTSYKLIF